MFSRRVKMPFDLWHRENDSIIKAVRELEMFFLLEHIFTFK